MPDSATVSLTLGEIAVRFGCALRGDPQRSVAAVATLDGGPQAVGFCANPALRGQLHHSHLGAVILRPSLANDCPAAVGALLHANPHAVFARVAAVLHPSLSVQAGIHASAIVHPTARVAASAAVGPFALVGARTEVGERCRIGAYACLGEDVRLGADTSLAERVTVLDRCRIGARCVVHAGAVIGSDGFGNARDGTEWIKVPQLGTVRIGDDVQIGANSTVDRGALDDTVIEDGVRLDNQIQVAHNVTIGAHTAIAACTGIAGSTRIGRRCMIGGGTGIGGQLVIGDDIVIAGFGMVTRSLERPGMYSSVLPVEEAGVWRRIVGRVKRLEQLVARVKRLETATKGEARSGREEDDQY
jgi:UDP-3-O-[3-hydroxymyristoyl] glucosamine N-acyltransferase